MVFISGSEKGHLHTMTPRPHSCSGAGLLHSSPGRGAHEPVPHARLAGEIEPGVVLAPGVQHLSELDILEARGLQALAQLEGIVKLLLMRAFGVEADYEFIYPRTDNLINLISCIAFVYCVITIFCSIFSTRSAPPETYTMRDCVRRRSCASLRRCCTPWAAPVT